MLFDIFVVSVWRHNNPGQKSVYQQAGLTYSGTFICTVPLYVEMFPHALKMLFKMLSMLADI